MSFGSGSNFNIGPGEASFLPPPSSSSNDSQSEEVSKASNSESTDSTNTNLENISSGLNNSENVASENTRLTTEEETVDPVTLSTETTTVITGEALDALQGDIEIFSAAPESNEPKDLRVFGPQLPREDKTASLNADAMFADDLLMEEEPLAGTIFEGLSPEEIAASATNSDISVEAQDPKSFEELYNNLKNAKTMEEAAAARKILLENYSPIEMGDLFNGLENASELRARFDEIAKNFDPENPEEYLNAYAKVHEEIVDARKGAELTIDPEQGEVLKGYFERFVRMDRHLLESNPELADKVGSYLSDLEAVITQSENVCRQGCSNTATEVSRSPDLSVDQQIYWRSVGTASNIELIEDSRRGVMSTERANSFVRSFVSVDSQAMGRRSEEEQATIVLGTSNSLLAEIDDNPHFAGAVGSFNERMSHMLGVELSTEAGLAHAMNVASMNEEATGIDFLAFNLHRSGKSLSLSDSDRVFYLDYLNSSVSEFNLLPGLSVDSTTTVEEISRYVFADNKAFLSGFEDKNLFSKTIGLAEKELKLSESQQVKVSSSEVHIERLADMMGVSVSVIKAAKTTGAAISLLNRAKDMGLEMHDIAELVEILVGNGADKSVLIEYTNHVVNLAYRDEAFRIDDYSNMTGAERADMLAKYAKSGSASRAKSEMKEDLSQHRLNRGFDSMDDWLQS